MTALSKTDCIVAPFVFDGLQARLAEQAGFTAVYMTGFGTAASYGKPDLGLLTMTEMVDRARLLTRAVRLPVLCDADTGYGNPLSVIRTVEEYQAAGVAGIHIEDQVFPKRCGFLQDKQVVDPSEMVQKLRAALDRRTDDSFVIIARTDALQPNGWDDVCRRAELYMSAGADYVFVDGIRDRTDLDAYTKKLSHLPLLYNGMLEPIAALADRGFKIVLHPGPMMALFENLERSYTTLFRDGALPPSRQDTFARFTGALDVPGTLERASAYETSFEK
jgi:2-methylisocitrate lyase-like PEP mutase family enzyme